MKGQPASVKVYAIPEFDQALSQKNFFKGDKVQMKWSSTGKSLLVLAQTEVDKSGKSYYGETTLYLLSVRASTEIRIDLGMLLPPRIINNDRRQGRPCT